MPTPTDYDRVILAKTLWGECRGETEEGKYAVAHVILNRANAPRWPNSAERVCMQPRQFSCWNTDSAERAAMMSIDLTSESYLECLKVANDVLDGKHPDNTLGATFYVTTITFPYWAKKPDGSYVEPCVTIGHHKFYNNIR